MAFRTQKISQMTPKGANLEGTDLLEVSTLESGSYVTRSITGQEIIDAVASSGVTDVTGTAPIVSTGGTTPDISIRQSSSVDDGYLTAVDWNTFNGKQAALVSGTNIKTVDGTSLLGSGDVSVGVTSVSGTAPISSSGGATPAISIATANTTTTGALSSTDWNTFNNKQNALTLTTTGTSGAATLVGSTLNIPQYSGGGGGGIHTLIKPITGVGYSNNLISGSTTFGNSGSVLYLTPFIPLNTLTITAASIQVTTAGAATNMKILVYSDSNGLPTTKLLESSLLDISTTGFKTYTASFTFNAGTTYWIGTIASGSAGAITSTSQTLQIGVATNSNTTYNGFSIGGINLASIPATLSLTLGNLAAISSQPRVTFVSA